MREEIQSHLARADELLRAARALIESGHPADSVSRSYYAMFHAAAAVLLDLGIERGSHRGVISALGEFVVKPGRMDSRYHASLRRAFEARSESDYLPAPRDTIQQAQAMLEEARQFVSACRSLPRKP